MSLVTVEIIAQYIDENGKSKNGQKFVLKGDADMFMYPPKEDIISVLQTLINDKMKGYAGHYKCLDFDLIFQEDIQLDGNKFESLLDQLYTNQK